MDILIKALQLILSLSLLVILHELGHYIPAKLFKTRVEKFYLFFNYKFSLFKKQIGETEWGIGWIPLGGYVKISGMIDESMDKDQLAQPAQPWEFRSKPAWQRLIIMCGGVTVNLILGFLIYICIVFSWGDDRIQPQNIEAGLSVAPMLNQYGLQSGDVVLAVNGEIIDDALDVNKEIMLRGERVLLVQHQDGSKETITLPEGIDYALFKSGAMLPFNYRFESQIIDSILPKDKSTSAGILQKGDKLIAIQGEPITYFDHSVTALYHNRGKKVDIEIERKGQRLTKKVQVTKSGTIGFAPKASKYMIDTNKIEHINYTFGESISRGSVYGMNTLGDYVGQLKYLFTSKGASSIGGFASIGNLFPATWDWLAFWEKTALISIILAFMNILPIPALDGGHVVFLLYEMITGKEAPQKVLEYAQYVGFILLIGLMLYANGNDLIKAIF